MALVGLAGCGEVKTDVDAPGASIDAGRDGPSIDGAPGTVLCGTDGTICPQACCDQPDPTPDMCITPQDPCSGAAMSCDGPEDCAGNGEVCCFYPGTRSICTTDTSCSAYRMCHDPSACLQSDTCCQLGGGPTTSPYQVCTPGPCPQ